MGKLKKTDQEIFNFLKAYSELEGSLMNYYECTLRPRDIDWVVAHWVEYDDDFAFSLHYPARLFRHILNIFDEYNLSSIQQIEFLRKLKFEYGCRGVKKLYN